METEGKIEKLIEEITKHVFNNPSDSTKILDACSSGLRLFAQHEKDKRDALASSVVRTMMGNKRNRLEWMIDIAYFQFPNGVDNHAPVEIKWWGNFIEVAKETKVDQRWLRNIKGYGVWWDEVVVPCLNS